MKNNIQKKYDIIIIGAGLAGLTNAYFLSKQGKKVCVLEKNPVSGGCMQGFVRKGFNFDTGAHYIGGLGENQYLNIYFSYLKIFNDVKFKKLDQNAFDIIKLNGEDYAFATGLENYIEKIVAKFPEEEKAVRTFAYKMKETAESFPYYNLSIKNDNNFPLNTDLNAFEYLKTLTNNELLQKVLFGSNLLYLGTKESTPFYLHSLINYGYIEGSWRAVGGSSKITESLLKSVKEFGVDVFFNSEVNNIKFISDSKVEIETADNNVFNSEKLISTIDPDLTLSLINSKLLRKSYRNRISTMETTEGFFTVYIKFKKNSFPYFNSNYYCFDNNDVWNNTFGNSSLFLTPPDAQNQKFANTGIILSAMRYNKVENWKNTDIENRGEAYETFKQNMAEILINKAQTNFPNFKNSIESVYTSTPLSYQDYTNTKKGSAYGILKKSDEFFQTNISYLTKIPNLYLNGQNVNIHGIHGVIVGAVMLSNHILGDDLLKQNILNF